jgi:NAD(P)-dependent dehydrogenase (short-subunit alcohol dehydrogenase family)
VIWVSGATEGLGYGLAKTVPYDNARIINMSRRAHPDYETIQFDLTKPETWGAVEASFKKELAKFTGKRVIFMHNAFYRGSARFVGEGERVTYNEEIIANGMAPQVLGDMFLQNVQPHYESGLVLISSAGARSPFEGHATYCASKAGVEMWVRVVRRELKRRGKQTWVVSVRPGFVDTPTTRAEAKISGDVYPVGPQIAKQLETREGVMTPEEAGAGIWAMLPPREDTSVLLQGEMVVVKNA